MIFLIILFFCLSLIALGVAAYSSAVQDTVLHHFASSIYYKFGTKKLVFGFAWNWWFRSDWKNKWITDENGKLILDENDNRIPRLTKILFWELQAVQLYDAWHFFKMLKIGMNILADIFASVTAVLIALTFSPSLLVWLILAIIYFIIQAFVWNYIFNNNYNNWMLSKVAKTTLEFKR